MSSALITENTMNIGIIVRTTIDRTGQNITARHEVQDYPPPCNHTRLIITYTNGKLESMQDAMEGDMMEVEYPNQTPNVSEALQYMNDMIGDRNYFEIHREISDSYEYDVKGKATLLKVSRIIATERGRRTNWGLEARLFHPSNEEASSEQTWSINAHSLNTNSKDIEVWFELQRILMNEIKS